MDMPGSAFDAHEMKVLAHHGDNLHPARLGKYQAVIAFDSDIQVFQGEFVVLNGGADFYAGDVEGVQHEGEILLL